MTTTIDTSKAGMEWSPTTFNVESEQVSEYARVCDFDSPIHSDPEAAKSAGYRDLVAPPMFCVVYAGAAMWPVLTDTELGMDFDNMVHGGQAFEWEEPVVAGDTITTVVRCTSISERRGMGMYEFESVSTNQLGQQVVRGVWSNIVRPSAKD